MKEIRLRLEDNPSRLEWDLRWRAAAPRICQRIISQPTVDGA